MRGEPCSKASCLCRGSEAQGTASCARLPDRACRESAFSVKHHQNNFSPTAVSGWLMNHTSAQMIFMFPHGKQEHTLSLQ